MPKPIAVSDADFEKTVLQSEQPVVVDFWAPWCGPCVRIAPILDKLASEYEGKLTIAKLNVDENNHSAGKYQVLSIPTLIVFKGGQEVERMVGLGPEAQYRKVFDKVLG